MASATVASMPTAAISRSHSSSTLMKHPLGPFANPEPNHFLNGLTHYDRGGALVKRIHEAMPIRGQFRSGVIPSLTTPVRVKHVLATPLRKREEPRHFALVEKV